MDIRVSKGDIVSFQLKHNGILGGERPQSVVESSSTSYEVARMIDPEVHVKHTSLYPYFKNDASVNNVDDPNIYEYLILKTIEGKLEVIGIPWINESTFTLIDGRTCRIEVENFKEEFRAPIRTFLSNLGAAYTLTVLDKTR